MQLDTIWESPQENMAIIEKLFTENKVKTDLLVLPEMFTTGFTMEPEKLAETMKGETSEWMAEKARDWNCVITGSIVIKAGQLVFEASYLL